MNKNRSKLLSIFLFALFGILLLFFLFTSTNQEDQKVSGIYLRSTIWRGTITVVGDVFIAPFATLYIMPDTKILFEKESDINGTSWTKYADSYIKDHNDPTGEKGYAATHYEISGTIIANGTSEHPIIVTSAQPKPEYADWDELVLGSGSFLDHVELAYAHNGINIEGSGVTITNSKIHDSLWSCIDIFSTENIINNNEIYHCWHQAVGLKVIGKNMILENTIHDAQLSINCEHGARPTIQNNNITAAPVTQECGAYEQSNKETKRQADTTGGTYGGKMIYPAR